MAYVDPKESTLAFKEVVARQGGGLLFHTRASYPDQWPSYATAVKRPTGYKPLSISVYNDDTKTDLFTLTLIVNPTDITIGQVYIANNTYTRRGWLTTLWGQQQSTISANGVSAMFITNATAFDSTAVGLTNYHRKNTLGFINLLSLIGIYKNNGYYFLQEIINESFFKDSTSRVIDVLDQIKISYDGTEYLGSFNIFTLDEDASKPFNLAYNFEFVVSGIQGDAIEGHTRISGREVGSITIGEQGYNTELNEIINMNQAELNRDLRIEPIGVPSADAYLARGQYGILDSQQRETIEGVDATVEYDSTKLTFDKLPSRSYDQQPESVKASVRQAAQNMGLSELQLASIIQFESAGTWSTVVENPYSSAKGLGQWTNAAAKQLGYRNSRDLVRKIDSIEGQVLLYPSYAEKTRVPGGRTLQQAIDAERTAQDKFNTYMIGHFYPAYVGRSLDTPFPAEVRAKNKGINTPRDYINYVNSRLDTLEAQAQKDLITSTTNN